MRTDSPVQKLKYPLQTFPDCETRSDFETLNFFEQMFFLVIPQDFKNGTSINSPWDRGCLGIKKGTIDVIYRWKAYLLEIQKIHVNTHKSVKGRSYVSPS